MRRAGRGRAPLDRLGATGIAAGLAVLAMGAAACAPTTMYHWNSYDERLYAHYRNPQDRETWVEGLKTTILEAEQRGRRVPPGVYADYGYALYEEGRLPEAIVYFGKERDQWPESRVLMDKMIRNAERRGPAQAGKAPAATGPAGALEGK
jgi:hypothetical protein